MTHRSFFLWLPLALVMAWMVPVRLLAEEKTSDSKQDSKPAKEEQEEPDKIVTTHHTAMIQGEEIKYTATAGKLAMKSDTGETRAHIFFVAYTKDGESDLGRRPVTFAFNGGPGSSSVWLHLGMLGPKRVKLPDDATALPPPYELSNNSYSLLDVTDLVFIDPVSTGFSRAAKGEDKSQFHGYQEDIRSVGQFIQEYLSKYGRWRSAKFLIGESYGGLRAGGLSGHLFDRYNMPLSGIVMVSPALNFSTIAQSPSNDLPFELFVPSYAATAWYHKALPGDLQQLPLAQIYRRAERFATGQYTLALMKGNALPAAERDAVAEKLSRFTGLSNRYVRSANMRISMPRFGKELLRDRGRTVGRYDSRYTGIDADNAGENAEYDPSGAAIFGPFTAAINDYLRNDLKFEDDHVYEILTDHVQPWTYDPTGVVPPDASDTLRRTMAENPLMKLFLACGYYDLATPPATVVYSVQHMRLPPELMANVRFGFYEGGHMMYIRESAMVKLRNDVAAFYKSALSPDAAE